MTMIRWRPLRRRLALRDAIDRMFEESLARSLWGWPEEEGGLSVPVDMFETEDGLVVESELPGLKPEDVEISITGNTLTIKGEFGTEKEEEGENFYMRERRFGQFQRSIALPSDVNTEAAAAKFADGVLRIQLPKTEAAKPKRIAVESE